MFLTVLNILNHSSSRTVARSLCDANEGTCFLICFSKIFQSGTNIFRSGDSASLSCSSNHSVTSLEHYYAVTRHLLQGTLLELGAHGPPERFGRSWQCPSSIVGNVIILQSKASLIHPVLHSNQQVLSFFGLSPHHNSDRWLRWIHQRTIHVSHCPQPKICNVGTNETDIWHWHEGPNV